MFITYYTIVFPSLISEYSVLITRIGIVVIATWSVSSQFGVAIFVTELGGPCPNSGAVSFEGLAFVDHEGCTEDRTSVVEWDGLAYGAFPDCVTSR